MYRGIICKSLKKKIIYLRTLNIWFTLTPYLNPTSQSLLPSPLKPCIGLYIPKQFCTHIFDISCTYMYIVKNIKWKLINFCLIVINLLLPIYIFVLYELAESACISLPFQPIVHILYLLYIYLAYFMCFYYFNCALYFFLIYFYVVEFTTIHRSIENKNRFIIKTHFIYIFSAVYIFL